MVTEKQPVTHGHCYCRGIHFTIADDAQPLLAGYCHCRDCRAANAATLHQYAYVDEGKFEIVAGRQLLHWDTRDRTIQHRFKRYFCKRCGTKVYNYLIVALSDNERAICGIFPSLFDDAGAAASPTWAPHEHIFLPAKSARLDPAQRWTAATRQTAGTRLGAE